MTMLTKKLLDKIRDVLETHGTSRIKQRLWDDDFSRGRWNCLDTTVDDCVYSRIEKSAKGGSILDLGCGSGGTANELNGSAYRDYTGVDISEVAVGKAKKRTEENGRGSRCRFLQGDVITYEPEQ